MAGVVLICGAICSGKTTYAREYMAKNRAVLLSMDEMMLGLFPQQLGESHDEISAKCRAYLLSKAADISRAGVEIILDWGFWTRADRVQVTDFFRKINVPVKWIWVKCDERTLDEHIEKRNASGDTGAYFVDENLKRKCLDRFEVPSEGEMDEVVSL